MCTLCVVMFLVNFESFKLKMNTQSILAFVLLIVPLNCSFHDTKFLFGNSSQTEFPSAAHNFSRTHTWVAFSSWLKHLYDNDTARNSPWSQPWIQPKQVFQSEQALLQMVQLVSSKFSQVVLDSISKVDWDKKNGESKIPLVIAKWNKNVNSSSRLLKVNMCFDLELSENKTQMTSFDLVKSLANEANKLHPGTVTTLTLDIDDDDDDDKIKYSVDEITAQLEYSRGRMSLDNEFNYKLALMAPLATCDAFSSLPVSSSFMTQIDEMIFSKYPYSSTREDKLKNAVEDLVSSYDNCVKKILHGYNISTSILTSWEDADETNNSFVVLFWQLMDNWAVAANTSVILYSAFDEYYRDKIYSTGWWHMDNTKKYRNPSEIVYEEKAKRNDFYL